MTKALVIVCVVSFAAAASAQTTNPSTERAGLKIMLVELQRTIVKAPAVRAVPATDPSAQSQARTDRMQDGDPDRAPALHRLSQNAEVAPKNAQYDPTGRPLASRYDPIGGVPPGASVVFVASVVVKNIGAKTVSAVHWEYLLFQTGGQEPIKRYRVQTKKIIPPGERAELTREVKPKGQEQQARITRIEYADGSSWQAK